MILVGLLGGLLAKKLKFPMVTGYIIVGVILSPSVLNILSETTINNMEIITSVALGIIAYEIGGSLPIRSIRTLGRSVIWVTIAETLGALLAVTLVLTFTGHTIIGNDQGTLLHGYLPIAVIIQQIRAHREIDIAVSPCHRGIIRDSDHPLDIP